MIVLSFILENIISNCNTIFLPIFTLISIIYLKNKKHYFLASFIIGIVYGLITDMFLLEGISFLLCSYTIYLLYKNLPNNYLIHLLITIIIILQYRFFNFLILILGRIIEFDLNKLLVSIYGSLILNLIYTSFLYFIICFKNKKRKKYIYLNR